MDMPLLKKNKCSLNPFHATNIQAETMYKVLTPNIKTSI